MRKNNINLNDRHILVTGAAGFIGAALAGRLLKGYAASDNAACGDARIVGLDNVNDYYDVSIKEWRLSQIAEYAKEHSDSAWTFIRGDISDSSVIKNTGR